MIKGKLIEMLAGLDVLENFTPGQINDHFFKKGYARIVEYETGERILFEGQYDNWVYWLIEGKVAVIKEGVMIACFQRTGDMFGEMSILGGDARSACVDALVPTLCFALDMSVLDHPELKNRISREVFCRNLAQLTRERLAQTTSRLSNAEKELFDLKKQLHETECALKGAEAMIRQLEERDQTQKKRFLELKSKIDRMERVREKTRILLS